jgi:hypothetical protein
MWRGGVGGFSINDWALTDEIRPAKSVSDNRARTMRFAAMMLLKCTVITDNVPQLGDF